MLEESFFGGGGGEEGFADVVATFSDDEVKHRRGLVKMVVALGDGRRVTTRNREEDPAAARTVAVAIIVFTMSLLYPVIDFEHFPSSTIVVSSY